MAHEELGHVAKLCSCPLKELQQRVASEANLLDWHAVASETDDVEDVRTNINSVDSR